MAVRLTREQKQMAFRLHAGGMKQQEIARELNTSKSTISVTVRGKRELPGKAAEWTPAPGRLTLDERVDIMIGLKEGWSMSAIARGLRRHPSTVTREVQANGGRALYGAWSAYCRARQRARRPKVAKIDHPPLLAQVSEWLEDLWSPEQIVGRLRIEYRDDPMMQVSHETIYQSLFVQGRGELRRELARCLRSGKTQRRGQVKDDGRGRISNMVMISERPAEVADRAVPGHWEGDLILGKNSRSAVGTLVERSTRYVLLLHLPDGRGPEAVEAAMRTAIASLPGEMFRTITWDQGKEMHRHAAFTIATGIPIFFCEPHSPWQRGSNENTNGLLRQYLPKGADLSTYSAEDLAQIQRSLNGRPRKTLEFMKPSEKLSEVLAHTG
jgi:IS30 family transposase